MIVIVQLSHAAVMLIAAIAVLMTLAAPKPQGWRQHLHLAVVTPFTSVLAAVGLYVLITLAGSLLQAAQQPRIEFPAAPPAKAKPQVGA